MTALDLSAILLTLAAAAFGMWGVIYVALVLGVTWVFGGMCRRSDGLGD